MTLRGRMRLCPAESVVWVCTCTLDSSWRQAQAGRLAGWRLRLRLRLGSGEPKQAQKLAA